MDKLVTDLEHAPLEIGAREPWPRGTYHEGWELRKERFRMPGLSGQSGKGRVIYLVHLAKRVVVPLIPYTHKRFVRRPDLKTMIKDELP